MTIPTEMTVVTFVEYEWSGDFPPPSFVTASPNLRKVIEADLRERFDVRESVDFKMVVEDNTTAYYYGIIDGEPNEEEYWVANIVPVK